MFQVQADCFPLCHHMFKTLDVVLHCISPSFTAFFIKWTDGARGGKGYGCAMLHVILRHSPRVIATLPNTWVLRGVAVACGGSANLSIFVTTTDPAHLISKCSKVCSMMSKQSRTAQWKIVCSDCWPTVLPVVWTEVWRDHFTECCFPRNFLDVYNTVMEAELILQYNQIRHCLWKNWISAYVKSTTILCSLSVFQVKEVV